MHSHGNRISYNPTKRFKRRKSGSILCLWLSIYSQESGVEPGNNTISIDIRSKSIEPGVYFIQLFDENQTITRKLIVK